MFHIKRYPVVARDRESVEIYYNASDQPWLALDDDDDTDRVDDAREHVIKAALRLLAHGIDGLRLDAMDDAPQSFWSELRERVRFSHPSALLLGEVVTDSLWFQAEARGADVVTDFRIKNALVDFVAKRTIDARAFVDSWMFARHRTGAFDASFRLGFLDNHDTARFLSLAGGDVARLHIGLALLLFHDETAWVTYGTEAHLAAMRGERALDNAWLERLPMPDPATVTTSTRALIRDLCALRRDMTRERAGAVRVVVADGSRLLLARRSHELAVDVATGALSFR